MATNFPTSLDSLTNPTASDPLNNPSHSDQHANVNDAVEALEAKVGVNGSAVTTSLDYKVAQTAPKDAQFVTLATNSTLTNERVLTAGQAITITDNGAGSTVTVAVSASPAIIGTIVEDVFTITDGAAFEIDPANGSIQLITLGANRTPKATNFLAGQAITLMVDDGTARTLTWTDATFGGSGVVWLSGAGSAPVLATSGYTAIVLWKVSSQVYGAKVG
jgi:hypothetical protein